LLRRKEFVMEPFSLAALGAFTLTEGVKFLYGQAGEILKRRRERKKAAEEGSPVPVAEAVEIQDQAILEGELAPPMIDFEAVEHLEEDLKVLSQRLGNYAGGIEEVDPADQELLRTIDALRRALEAIYQQRITFKGEDRPPSGPLVEGRVDVGEVAGYAAAVRAEVIESGRVTGTLTAKEVKPGAEAVAVDIKRIGG
jgi:hypothetical protein